jgi:hypothetical protein
MPAHLPLNGIRVVELTSNIAAPSAGAILADLADLADLGAHVVHVESGRGDDSRRMSPRLGIASAYWHVVTRNKHIASLDFKHPADRASHDALVDDADVLLTILRPGKLRQHRLDHASLTQQHPASSTRDSPNTATPARNATGRATTPCSKPAPASPKPPARATDGPCAPECPSSTSARAPGSHSA